MILVDTWAWVALADRSDPNHAKVVAAHQQFTRLNRLYVTTDFVLSEVITYLYDALPAPHAQSFVSSLFTGVNAGMYRLLHLSPQQFHRAWIMRQRYHDKPDISFVDFASFVVMQELGITDVFTGDAHFHQVNLGFHLVP
jgi:predicted nucleic acid-binding protein